MPKKVSRNKKKDRNKRNAALLIGLGLGALGMSGLVTARKGVQPCPVGQEIHPITKKCVPKCPVGSFRDAKTGECVPLPSRQCSIDQFKNPIGVLTPFTCADGGLLQLACQNKSREYKLDIDFSQPQEIVGISVDKESLSREWDVAFDGWQAGFEVTIFKCEVDGLWYAIKYPAVLTDLTCNPEDFVNAQVKTVYKWDDVDNSNLKAMSIKNKKNYKLEIITDEVIGIVSKGSSPDFFQRTPEESFVGWTQTQVLKFPDKWVGTDVIVLQCPTDGKYYAVKYNSVLTDETPKCDKSFFVKTSSTEYNCDDTIHMQELCRRKGRKIKLIVHHETHPLEIIGRIKDIPERSTDEIINGWENGFEIDKQHCDVDNEEYWVKWSCELRFADCTLLGELKSTDAVFTCKPKNPDGSYPDLLSEYCDQSGKKWELNIDGDNPLEIVDVRDDKSYSRTVSEAVSGWKQSKLTTFPDSWSGTEVLVFRCTYDMKLYAVRYPSVLKDVTPKCNLNEFKGFGLNEFKCEDTIHMQELCRQEGKRVKLLVDRDTPLEIVGRVKDIPERSTQEIITGWRAGYEITKFQCTTDGEEYWIKYPASIVPDQCVVTDDIFKQGTTSYTCQPQNSDGTYPDLLSEACSRTGFKYELTVDRNSPEIIDIFSTPQTRSWNQALSEWQKSPDPTDPSKWTGHEYTNILCSIDNKYYWTRYPSILVITDRIYGSAEISNVSYNPQIISDGGSFNVSYTLKNTTANNFFIRSSVRVKEPISGTVSFTSNSREDYLVSGQTKTINANMNASQFVNGVIDYEVFIEGNFTGSPLMLTPKLRVLKSCNINNLDLVGVQSQYTCTSPASTLITQLCQNTNQQYILDVNKSSGVVMQVLGGTPRDRSVNEALSDWQSLGLVSGTDNKWNGYEYQNVFCNTDQKWYWVRFNSVLTLVSCGLSSFVNPNAPSVFTCDMPSLLSQFCDRTCLKWKLTLNLSSPLEIVDVRNDNSYSRTLSQAEIGWKQKNEDVGGDPSRKYSGFDIIVLLCPNNQKYYAVKYPTILEMLPLDQNQSVMNILSEYNCDNSVDSSGNALNLLGELCVTSNDYYKLILDKSQAQIIGVGSSPPNRTLTQAVDGWKSRGSLSAIKWMGYELQGIECLSSTDPRGKWYWVQFPSTLEKFSKFKAQLVGDGISFSPQSINEGGSVNITLNYKNVSEFDGGSFQIYAKIVANPPHSPPVLAESNRVIVTVPPSGTGSTTVTAVNIPRVTTGINVWGRAIDEDGRELSLSETCCLTVLERKNVVVQYWSGGGSGTPEETMANQLISSGIATDKIQTNDKNTLKNFMNSKNSKLAILLGGDQANPVPNSLANAFINSIISSDTASKSFKFIEQSVPDVLYISVYGYCIQGTQDAVNYLINNPSYVAYAPPFGLITINPNSCVYTPPPEVVPQLRLDRVSVPSGIIVGNTTPNSFVHEFTTNFFSCDWDQMDYAFDLVLLNNPTPTHSGTNIVLYRRWIYNNQVIDDENQTGQVLPASPGLIMTKDYQRIYPKYFRLPATGSPLNVKFQISDKSNFSRILVEDTLNLQPINYDLC